MKPRRLSPEPDVRGGERSNIRRPVPPVHPFPAAPPPFGRSAVRTGALQDWRFMTA